VYELKFLAKELLAHKCKPGFAADGCGARRDPALMKGVIMNERQWELYRMSVVETWSESPYKRAVSAAIEHKLKILGQHTPTGVNPTTNLGFGRYPL